MLSIACANRDVQMPEPESDIANEAIPSLADDKLSGVKQIARFIDEPMRRAFYLLERGYLPAGKVGNTWTASKRVLRAHYARITGGDR